MIKNLVAGITSDEIHAPNDFAPKKVSIRHIYLQPTTFCNLRCSYCYLSTSKRSYRNEMSLVTLNKIIRHLKDHLVHRESKKVQLTWHSGEPLARGLDFYVEASKVISRELPLIRVQMQTNATLINRKFCELFEQYKYHIGVSMDGYEELHNHHRTYASKKGSFKNTLRGLKTLSEYKVPYSFISVLSKKTLEDGDTDKLIDFFFEFDPRDIGFSIEEIDGIYGGSDLHLISKRNEIRELYRNFLIRLFRSASKRKVLHKIREFRRTYSKLSMIVSNKNFISTSSMIEPFAHISYDYLGKYSCFSPELLTMKDSEGNDFIFGSLDNLKCSDLNQATNQEKFRSTNYSILSGVKRCKETCEYFGICPGGVPSNKLAENGTFESTQTFACQTTVMDAAYAVGAFLKEQF